MFYDFLGVRQTKRIRLAVMDMWKAFRTATDAQAPEAAIRIGSTSRDKSTCCGRTGRISRRRSDDGSRRAWPRTSDSTPGISCRSSSDNAWEYRRESWARKFFDQWRASLQWQRQRPFEKFAELIEQYCDGISAYCRPQNKVALGVVEGLNNKIRVIQRRCYGIRDEDYLQLKILPCTLPPAYFGEADHSVRTKSITGFGPKRSHVSRHVDHRMRWGHGIG